MKYIEDRDGFLNEALRRDAAKQEKEKKVLVLLEDLYKMFNGDTGVYIANETPEQREARLYNGKIYKRKVIANETPEENEIRLAKAREYYHRKKKENKKKK